MPDISKVNAVAIGDISKIAGVAKASISKFGGADVPANGTEQATKWLIGANSGRLYANTSSTFTSSGTGDGVELLCDFGTNNVYGVAMGLDDAGEKRWAFHYDRAGRYIYYISASGDWTDTDEWTCNDYGAGGKKCMRGGPGLVYSNETGADGKTGYWYAVGGGRHLGDNVRYVMMTASQTQISARQFREVANTAFIGGNNASYAIVNKEADTWIYGLGVTKFFKTTDGESTTATWASGAADTGGYDVYSMGYDPDNNIWAAGSSNGKMWSSGDDWATLTASVTPFGTSTCWGVIYVKGSINKWIAVATNGKIAYSEDGTSPLAFTASTLPSPIGSSHHMRGVASDHTTIVACGSTSGGNNCILTSSNGTDWTYVSSSAMGNVNFESVACDVVGAASN